MVVAMVLHVHNKCVQLVFMFLLTYARHIYWFHVIYPKLHKTLPKDKKVMSNLKMSVAIFGTVVYILKTSC